MHFFGSIGLLLFVLGFLAAIWLGAQKLYCLRHGIPAPLVTSSPYFYIFLVFMIMGLQLFLAGYLAELIGRNSPTRNTYLIAELLGTDCHGEQEQ